MFVIERAYANLQGTWQKFDGLWLMFTSNSKENCQDGAREPPVFCKESEANAHHENLGQIIDESFEQSLAQAGQGG